MEWQRCARGTSSGQTVPSLRGRPLQAFAHPLPSRRDISETLTPRRICHPRSRPPTVVPARGERPVISPSAYLAYMRDLLALEAEDVDDSYRHNMPNR
jgi:hypothetical protein